MSKRSRQRNRLLKLQAEQSVASQLITGNMAERAAAIIKQDNNNNGHKVKVDNRLPVHYGGPANNNNPVNGIHYVTHGQPLVKVSTSQLQQADNIGYRLTGDSDDNSIFRVASPDITEGSCPIASIPKVYVDIKLWKEWINLAEDYDTEWLAYLTGQFVKDDNGSRYEINKMYFPPQIAHAAHVDVDDDFSHYLPNTIGAIHSHVKMGVFFSGEDLRHSNWPVEIVVNAKGEYKLMIRHQLECGKWIKNYSDIMTVGDNSDSRYVASLDKAFEAGQQLKQQRYNKVAAAIGYRTPQVDNNSHPCKVNPFLNHTVTPNNPPSFRKDNDKEWHFRINNKPVEWRECNMEGGGKSGEYVEVVKVGDKWVFIDDPELIKYPIVNNVTTDHPSDATGDSTELSPYDSLTMAQQAEMFKGSIEIDDSTGQITIVGDNDDGSKMSGIAAASQEELDRLMEQEVDAASCSDCGGTGRIMTNGANIECTGCGGSGLKPGLYGMGGYEGYTC